MSYICSRKADDWDICVHGFLREMIQCEPGWVWYCGKTGFERVGCFSASDFSEWKLVETGRTPSIFPTVSSVPVMRSHLAKDCCS